MPQSLRLGQIPTIVICHSDCSFAFSSAFGVLWVSSVLIYLILQESLFSCLLSLCVWTLSIDVIPSVREIRSLSDLLEGEHISHVCDCSSWTVSVEVVACSWICFISKCFSRATPIQMKVWSGQPEWNFKDRLVIFLWLGSKVSSSYASQTAKFSWALSQKATRKLKNHV